MKLVYQQPAPTPYPDVNTLLHALLDGVRAALGPRFIGMYLYGSLSLGDFDPASSDVDFLVVTTEQLPDDAIERLRALHATIAASGLPYATYCEGSYIPRAALRRYDPANAVHPTISTEEPLHLGRHESNWVLEYAILREHGVTVVGPPPSTLIDPVTPDDLRAATRAQLAVWQARAEDVTWLRPRYYQAFAVLTLCRALYTLTRGALVSKPHAAAWATEAYPQWQPIIERSLRWRADHADDDPAETMAVLRAALAEAQHP